MKTSKVLFLVSLIPLAIGLSLLWWGYGSYQDTQQLLASGVRAPAQVTDMIEKYDSDTGTLYYPEFTFEDSRKKTHTFRSNVGTYPPSNKIGDQVTVIYPIGSPEQAQQEEFWSLWIGVFVCGLIGGVFTLIGAGVLIGGIVSGRSGNQFS